jgi:hypothetical protein
MLKERKILLLAISCIFLSLPLSYLVSAYGLFDFIQFMPLLLMSIVLAYAGFYVKWLLANNEKKKAGALVVALMALVLIAFVVLALSFNMNERIVGFDYPPGAM